MTIPRGAVTLRPVEHGDLDVFFSQQADPAAMRMAAFTAKDPHDRAAFRAHWARMQKDSSVTLRTIVVEEQVAGSIGSFVLSGLLQVTYWIGREFWGRGIATQALRCFLQEVRTRPIYGQAAADNAASIRVLEKCGFVRIGTERGFANARGEEIDEAIMMLDTLKAVPC